MMSIFRKLETKFIPGAVIFCSIIFLTMHVRTPFPLLLVLHITCGICAYVLYGGCLAL